MRSNSCLEALIPVRVMATHPDSVFIAVPDVKKLYVIESPDATPVHTYMQWAGMFASETIKGALALQPVKIYQDGDPLMFTRTIDNKRYELVDHASTELSTSLGNVRVTFSDRKRSTINGGIPGDFHADVTTMTDYYPFGMEMPGRVWNGGEYRFGFNGKEKESSITSVEGSHLDFGARIYDSRIGRWLSIFSQT